MNILLRSLFHAHAIAMACAHDCYYVRLRSLRHAHPIAITCACDSYDMTCASDNYDVPRDSHNQQKDQVAQCTSNKMDDIATRVIDK